MRQNDDDDDDSTVIYSLIVPLLPYAASVALSVFV